MNKLIILRGLMLFLLGWWVLVSVYIICMLEKNDIYIEK